MGTRRTRRFWLCWALALAVTAVWTISASPVQTSQPVGGAAHGSYVALTFDDGPWPGTTNALLDGLAQRGVKATFFLVGEQVADRAETVRRMADEGHQIGLHTWHHVSLKGMTPDQITSQLDQTRAAIRGFMSEGVQMGEGWLLTAEMLELIEGGVTNVVCTQPFGCLPNHIVGKGMMKAVREKHPGVNLVSIDYDSSASRINQENRLKLMLAAATRQEGQPFAEPTEKEEEESLLMR